MTEKTIIDPKMRILKALREIISKIESEDIMAETEEDLEKIQTKAENIVTSQVFIEDIIRNAMSSEITPNQQEFIMKHNIFFRKNLRVLTGRNRIPLKTSDIHDTLAFNPKKRYFGLFLRHPFEKIGDIKARYCNLVKSEFTALKISEDGFYDFNEVIDLLYRIMGIIEKEPSLGTVIQNFTQTNEVISLEDMVYLTKYKIFWKKQISVQPQKGKNVPRINLKEKELGFKHNQFDPNFNYFGIFIPSHVFLPMYEYKKGKQIEKTLDYNQDAYEMIKSLTPKELFHLCAYRIARYIQELNLNISIKFEGKLFTRRINECLQYLDKIIQKMPKDIRIISFRHFMDVVERRVGEFEQNKELCESDANLVVSGSKKCLTCMNCRIEDGAFGYNCIKYMQPESCMSEYQKIKQHKCDYEYIKVMFGHEIKVCTVCGKTNHNEES